MTDILIVEDGLQEQARLMKLAADAGYSAMAVGDAEQAIGLLTYQRFRLVILDLGLEGKSGLHLFRQIRELPTRPLVVVLTGNPSTHLKQRFIDEGATAYLLKGSEAAANDSLLDIIKALLSEGAKEESLQYRSIPLHEFLRDYVTPSSRTLFYAPNDELPECTDCGGKSWLVAFHHKTQLPPLVEGKVCCAQCGANLDPELG